MSHFSILVVGENPEDQLAPFHEFECTGEDDQYIQDIDETEETRNEFDKSTTIRIKDSDGKLHCPYDDNFYREPTPAEEKKVGMGTGCARGGVAYTSKDWGDGKGYRAKVKFVPEGMIEVTVKREEIETFAEYLEDYEGKKPVPFGEEPSLEDAHKYGYFTVDEKGEVLKIINRTNPNAKWDWYQTGGRYQGHFKLKDGGKGEVGSVSLVGAMQGQELVQGHVDQAQKKDIDFEGMREKSATEAGERYDKLFRLMGEEIPELKYTWKEVFDDERFEKLDVNEKRAIYHAQEPLEKISNLRRKDGGLEEEEDRSFLTWLDYENYLGGRDKYIEKAKNSALSTFGLLKDGEWYERGQMGWFACVNNEKDVDEWDKEFSKLLDGISDETLLTVVDCHI